MTSPDQPPPYRESWLRRSLPVLLPFSLIVLLALLWLVLMRLFPPSAPLFGIPPEEIKFSITQMEPPSGLSAGGDIVPGFYCNSCGSDDCRQQCVASQAATGMHNRFFWCEVMPAEGVYDFSKVTNWVRVNQNMGLRSIIGFAPKTDRGTGPTSGGSCTPDSNGSPSWMLRPGSVYQPLMNGEGSTTSYHLDLTNTAVQSQLRAALQQFRLEVAALPLPVRDSIDSIEVDLGHDGEPRPARNYDDYPPDEPLGWMDLDMYRCIYAGFQWQGAPDKQRCIDGNGNPVNPQLAFGASVTWRDQALKPIIDIYGQELSKLVQGDVRGLPMVAVVSHQLLSPYDERVASCQGCNNLNYVDYAFSQYGIGVKTSGVTPDLGNGQGADTLGDEYRNWVNIFKLDWPQRLVSGEHGALNIGSGHCCDDPKELYWAVLNGLDKHLQQLHFPVAHFAQNDPGAAEARQMMARYAGRTLENTPDVWIVFRDTEGTYFPDGDNGGGSGDPPGSPPCCRNLPNYEWFIYQRNPQRAQVVRNGLPDSYKSLSARNNRTGPLKLDIEDMWSGAAQQPLAAGGCAVYTVDVEYQDSGSDSFSLRYADFAGNVVDLPVSKSNSGQWRTASFTLNDAYFNDSLPGSTDLELVNPDSRADVFHRVTVSLDGACSGATPTATLSTFRTSTPTATPNLTPSATPSATRTATPIPQSVTLQPGVAGYAGVDDATLSSWNGGDETRGSTSRVSIRPFDVWAGVIRFDLANAVPAGAVIQSATLDLNVVSRSNNSNWADVGVFALLRAWDESRVSWNRASSSTSWTIPGANGINSDRTGIMLDEQRLDEVGVWESFDVTSAVRDWTSGAQANNGLILKGGDGSGNVSYDFASSEYFDIALRPRLTIRFQAMTATPTPTMTVIPTRTPTRTPAHTATPTASRTPTPTHSATATRTVTPAPASTATPAALRSATPTPSATSTRTATPTPSVTATPTPNSPLSCLPVPQTAIPLGDSPKGMAASPELVYAAVFTTPRLAMVQAGDNSLLGTQPVGPGGVNGVAVVGDQVYTSNRNAGTVSINEADSGQFVRTILVGSLPWGVGGSNGRVYVANFADKTVSVISIASNSVIKTTPVSAMPAFVVASPNRAYVSHISGWLTVLARDGGVLANINLAPLGQLWGMALNEGNSRLYVADRPGNRILVLNTATNQLAGEIALPGSPYALAYNPGTGHLFAVDAGTDQVHVVDTRDNNQYLGAVQVGRQDSNEGGQGIAVAYNKVFIGNWLDQSITVLDDAVCQASTTPQPQPTQTATLVPR